MLPPLCSPRRNTVGVASGWMLQAGFGVAAPALAGTASAPHAGRKNRDFLTPLIHPPPARSFVCFAFFLPCFLCFFLCALCFFGFALPGPLKPGVAGAGDGGGALAGGTQLASPLQIGASTGSANPPPSR